MSRHRRRGVDYRPASDFRPLAGVSPTGPVRRRLVELLHIVRLGA
jgi:hypothetical protein